MCVCVACVCVCGMCVCVCVACVCVCVCVEKWRFSAFYNLDHLLHAHSFNYRISSGPITVTKLVCIVYKYVCIYYVCTYNVYMFNYVCVCLAC